jgi:hypothetical protein
LKLSLFNIFSSSYTWAQQGAAEDRTITAVLQD